MATLTEVSYYTRKTVVGLAIAFVVILVSPLIFGGVKAIYLKLFPTPPPPATRGYGQLPDLIFPKGTAAYKPNYRLETIAGKLPDLERLAKVFVVEINRNRLLELDRIRARARSLELRDEPREVDERTYVFNHPVLPIEMAVDIIYGSYGYKYTWKGDAEFIRARAVPGKDEAQPAAKSFFQALGILPSDLVNGVTTYTFLTGGIDGQMVATGSLSQANFVRVDLFRTNIEKLKVVTTDWDTSAVNVIFSGQTDRLKRLVGANYNYSRIAAEGYETYVLKSAQQAWSELTGGGGYVPKPAGENVVVRNAYLAYFESNQPQEFLQPVFVFEGDGGFVGYVPAIDPTYPDRPSGN